LTYDRPEPDAAFRGNTIHCQAQIPGWAEDDGNMHPHRLSLVICLFLATATIVTFWQVRDHGFVDYDDFQYVVENPHVQSGLTWEGVIWAFTTTYMSNWHPLTWLSHMTDCQIYGMNAGGHHFTNLLFHVANTLFLFIALKRMTKALWRSAFVAAVFALHPLHVESVAWVAERKDILSTLFWMLTMLTYVLYVECPGYVRYSLVLLSFTLGLMAKPMLVTLPFVLLLLDYWPLQRVRMKGSKEGDKPQSYTPNNNPDQKRILFRLIGEKAPFFLLAAASSVVTFLAQQSGGSVRSLDVLPIQIRVANAVISYIAYIGKMIWPSKLAVFYPHTGMPPTWQIAVATLLLACISVLVTWIARRSPYALVGWLWYLGTLVPVIGLVQVASLSMADRYTYVPLIGLFIIIGWSFHEVVARRPYRRVVSGTSIGALLVALIICSRMQVRHWRNSVSLFQHTVDVTTDNYYPQYILGKALARQGKLDEAISNYAKALQMAPSYAEVYFSLGVALAEQGKLEEAISNYAKALHIKPNYAESLNSLGFALARQGRFQEAISRYSEALRIRPDYASAHNNLGIALAEQGRLEEAISNYSNAIRTRPTFAEAHNNLGVALARQGNLDEAIGHFSKAVRIQSDYAEAHNNLGVALARQGKSDKAFGHFSEAVRIKPDYSQASNNLRILREARKSETGISTPVGQ
jgi:Flp pilus assembly protein TadD